MPIPLAFTAYDYNESSYTADVWTPAVPADSSTATWKLREQPIPEGAEIGIIKPVPIGSQTTSAQVFDLGRIASGFIRINVKNREAGRRITMYYAEDYNASTGRIPTSGSSSNVNVTVHWSAYTFSGAPEESFCPDFSYRAYRYVEFRNLDRLLEPDEVEFVWAATGLNYTADFDSSDDLLNRIYQMCINTQVNNVLNAPTDCPQREQAQYLGDSESQFDLLSYAFSDFEAINYKTLADFAYAQQENGRFRYIAPGGNLVSTGGTLIPEYDLRYPQMLYTYYFYSGKTDALTSFYAAAVKNVEFYVDLAMRDNGLLHTLPSGTYWHIADHPEHQIGLSRSSNGRPDDPYQTMFNLHMYDAMNHLSKVAAIIGKTADAAAWAERAANISNAINTYMTDENGLYFDGLFEDSSPINLQNPGVTAYAIFSGQADPVYRKNQLDHVTTVYNTLDRDFSNPSNEHPSNGAILMRIIFNVLMNAGGEYADICYKILMKPGDWQWVAWLNNGFSTTYEGFYKWTGVYSGSHAWTAFPAKTLLADFAGIRYTGVNYTDIEIKPYLPADLDYLTGKLESPHGGDIRSTVERDANTLKLTVDTDYAATVYMPTFNPDSMTVNGQLNNALPTGVVYLGYDDGYAMFSIPSGNYVFLAHLRNLADIRADETNVVVNNPASYTVSLDNAKGTGVVELSFTFDGYVLDKDSITATPLNSFTQGIYPDLTFQYMGSGMWKGTVKYMYLPSGGGYVKVDGPLDILKISGTAIDTGPATVKLTSIAVQGDTGTGVGIIPSAIKTAEATATIVSKQAVYSKYDLNKDGSIDETDLLYLVYFYQWTDRDPGWAIEGLYGVYAKDCDFQVNGKIDLADMIELTANYGTYNPYA